MTISTAKMTAQQFLELGEDPPGIHLELVNGAVAVSPSPIPNHSHVVVQLTFLLVQHVRRHKLGRIYADVDTIFGYNDVRRPDLIFFSRDRLHLVGEKALEGPPDLCVEVISPSSTRIDRKDKYKQYEKAGVQNYWIVDPHKRTMEAFTLIKGKYKSTGSGKQDQVVKFAPFSNLKLPLGDIWQPED